MIILRQKEYARKDYEGLTDKNKDLLRKKRSELAKELLSDRKRINKKYNDSITAANLKKTESEDLLRSIKTDLGTAINNSDKELGKKIDDAYNYVDSGGYFRDKERAKFNRAQKYNDVLYDISDDAEYERNRLLKKQVEEEKFKKLDREDLVRENKRNSNPSGNNNTTINKGRTSKIIEWAKKNKKPLIGAGIGLATIGTGAYLYNRNK